MTLPRLYVALLCLVLTAVPGFPADESPRFAAYPDGVYVTRIGDAGIPVILKPGATAPVVEVQLWVHAGSKNEPAPIRGISHYLEHLFYRGTSKRGPLENRLEIIDVGGVTTAGTWYDWTYYRNKVRSADLERAIDTLTDSLMDLTLAPEAVEAERRVVGSEIRLREDDPGIYAWEESMRLLFPDHPYGERIIGDFETTGRITQADFRDYYQRSYHPDNAAWVIVGDYDPEVALDMLEERLGSFSRPAEPRSAPAVPDDPPGYQQVLRTKPVSEPSLSLAFRMPGFRHPDRPAAEAIAHMLVEREDSLLETIRLEGTAGTTSGGYTILEDAGMLTLEATPAPETTIEHLLSEVVGVVRDLQEGFNPNYLAVTKQALIQQITSGRDTTDR
ncbi:MAG TPA: pitrilysin family protein, partial [bacterium]|nr:pitrilysin family protein [bacterium]